ncbi:uncharacterized protein LOC34617744 [Cyclospora cayetanensis]|uniref:Uncharacterized protein LOC34617744 n=1 Tax=Cyclospora cayetanensis TaxID=88456 RepID=A0A6P6RVE4_9EIME|nr:uncharacterized protein LOC34617744 [Cyclospora cayetanensis]
MLEKSEYTGTRSATALGVLEAVGSETHCAVYCVTSAYSGSPTEWTFNEADWFSVSQGSLRRSLETSKNTTVGPPMETGPQHEPPLEPLLTRVASESFDSKCRGSGLTLKRRGNRSPTMHSQCSNKESSFEDNMKGMEREQSMGSDQVRRGEFEQPSAHALHSTWEEIYQRELKAAAARKAYISRQGRRSVRERETVDSGSRSESRSSSVSSDTSSIEGEEWFGPECIKIASWVSSTLGKTHNHPLQLYFRALHASRGTFGSVGEACVGSSCDWCRGEGILISKEFMRLPVLDVGCGGGQVLARLKRCGFQRLAGIDYSASAIQLAKSNLRYRHFEENGGKGFHICLRQADLRDLKPLRDPTATNMHLPCICCHCESCRAPASSHEETHADERADPLASSTCEPVDGLPHFPVVFDKGTFDVFWLMHTPEVYVQCMHRLMPQYGLLFLTSCNCTVEELDALFCFKSEAAAQPTAEQTPGTRVDGATPESAPGPSISTTPYCGISTSLTKDLCNGDASGGSLDTKSGVAFERIGTLPHRSFKFGGAEGQVVTSVLLRRL